MPASDSLEADVEKLRKLYGVTSDAETIRKAVASELLLREALTQNKELRIQGKNPRGKTINVLI